MKNPITDSELRKRNAHASSGKAVNQTHVFHVEQLTAQESALLTALQNLIQAAEIGADAQPYGFAAALARAKRTVATITNPRN